ncbi:hypothetical protein FACS1894178_7210 [Bacteroidia bacterium]|nr:hypothetical protein FACS1894178_7210 [Bacteroidia bacterium]
MYYRFLILLTTVLLSAQVFAIPACPELVTTNQPDNTTISYYIRGDEKVHWKTSPNGYTLMYNNNNFLVFAHKDINGNLEPSNIVFRGDNLKKYSATERKIISTIEKDLRYSQEQVATLKQIWSISQRSSESISSIQGYKHVLVILAAFSDVPFTITKSQFDALMNQDNYVGNGNAGSVRDFYRVNSYGKLDFHVTLAGPVTLPGTAASYVGNEQSFAKKSAELASSLVNYADFADGLYVPSFHIIFAGHGDEAISNGKQIWSHAWAFTPIVLDGVYVGNRYSCSPELSGGSGNVMTKIGVIAHELCHTFGAPDYYDTDYGDSGGEYPGTGKWDLMASGSWNGNGACPANINMYQKILFGWVNPIDLTTPLTVSQMPNSNDSAVAYRIAANGNEVYILESRWKRGFDSEIPGEGLLIYHAHAAAVNNGASNTTSPQQMYVVAANATSAIPDATVGSYGAVNAATATFGTTKTEFSGSSIPAMFKWNGNSGIAIFGKELSEITKNGNFKIISFKYRGGNGPFVEPSLNCPDEINSLPYFEDFEFGTTCEKKHLDDSTNTNICGVRTGIVGGVNQNAFAKDAYAWIFSSDSIVSSGNYRQMLVLPEFNLNENENLYLSFYYRRLRTSIETLKAGYTTHNNPNDTIWLHQVDITDNAWGVYYRDDIPPNVKNIFIAYLSVNKRYLSVDNITVDLKSESSIQNVILPVFSYYPNPVENVLFLNVMNSHTLGNRYIIFDLNGNQILNSQFSILNSQLSIDVSHLSTGIYILQLTTDKGIISQKFIKK